MCEAEPAPFHVFCSRWLSTVNPQPSQHHTNFADGMPTIPYQQFHLEMLNSQRWLCARTAVRRFAYLPRSDSGLTFRVIQCFDLKSEGLNWKTRLCWTCEEPLFQKNRLFFDVECFVLVFPITAWVQVYSGQKASIWHLLRFFLRNYWSILSADLENLPGCPENHATFTAIPCERPV